jgi:hypothetical protein
MPELRVSSINLERCAHIPTRSGATQFKKVRIIWVQFGLLLVDAATLVPYVLVLLTGIRARKMCGKLKKASDKYEEDLEFNFKKVAVVWFQAWSLLVDAVFVPLCFLVLLSGWRTRALLAVMSDEKIKGMERRCAAINQFFQMLLDVPFILMGLLVLLIAPWRWCATLTKDPIEDCMHVHPRVMCMPCLRMCMPWPAFYM